MKKIFICLFSLVILGAVKAQDKPVINASMNKVKLNFMLDADGKPAYSVFYGDKPVINNSYLGIKLANDSAFDKNFVLTVLLILLKIRNRFNHCLFQESLIYSFLE